MERRTFLARAVAVTAPLLAGCTGDDAGDAPTETTTEASAASPTAGPTASPTEGAPSAQEEYPDYSWGALEGVDPVPSSTVTLRNTAFTPPVAAVQPGATVTFENNDSFGHTVTIPALDVDQELDGGASTTVTFDAAGTYDYLCTLHPPGMVGRVVVSDSTPTPTATPTAGETPTDTPKDGGTPTPTPTEDDGGYY
jgi:plastocyanin